MNQIAEIQMLEHQLAQAKDGLALEEKSERAAKWKAALKKCHEARDKCQSIRLQVLAAIASREKAYKAAYSASEKLREFESSIPSGDYDFRLPAAIEAEATELAELRAAFELARLAALPTNGVYGNALSEWLKSLAEFEAASFAEVQLRPQPRRRAS